MPWPERHRDIFQPAGMATIAGLLAEDVTVQEVPEHYPKLTVQDLQPAKPKPPAATRR